MEACRGGLRGSRPRGNDGKGMEDHRKASENSSKSIEIHRKAWFSRRFPRLDPGVKLSLIQAIDRKHVVPVQHCAIWGYPRYQEVPRSA